MKLLIKPSSKSEIQDVVWVLFVKKVLTMEICYYLIAIYGENIMSVQMFANGVNNLKLDGNQSIINKPCAGCPIKVHTEENRHRVEKLIVGLQ